MITGLDGFNGNRASFCADQSAPCNTLLVAAPRGEGDAPLHIPAGDERSFRRRDRRPAQLDDPVVLPPGVRQALGRGPVPGEGAADVDLGHALGPEEAGVADGHHAVLRGHVGPLREDAEDHFSTCSQLKSLTGSPSAGSHRSHPMDCSIRYLPIVTVSAVVLGHAGGLRPLQHAADLVPVPGLSTRRMTAMAFHHD